MPITPNRTFRLTDEQYSRMKQTAAKWRMTMTQLLIHWIEGGQK